MKINIIVRPIKKLFSFLMAIVLVALLSCPPIPISVADTFTGMDVFIQDNTPGSTDPGALTFKFTSGATTTGVGGKILITVPSDFTAANDDVISLLSSLTINGAEKLGNVSTANITSRVITITLDGSTAVTAGHPVVVSFADDASDDVIEGNPATAGWYTFSFATTESDDDPIDSGTLDVAISASEIDDGAVAFGTSSSAGADPGTATFTFTNKTEIPSGGQIVITLPDDFTAGDATVTGDTTLTAGSATVASATLSSYVITITTATAAIPAQTNITVEFADDVVDTNPASAGQYSIHLLTKNASGSILDTGVALAGIGNTVQFTTVVHEAIIMTLDNTSISLEVDPSVNNGVDNSQTTNITIASNAYDGFVVKARIRDTNSADAQLLGAVHAYAFETDATDHYLKFHSTTPATGTNDLSNGGIQGDSGTPVDFNTDSTPATIYTADTGGNDLINDADVLVTYHLKADYMVPADSYAGTITYTILPNF